jgi:hypothetical protein
MKAPSHWLVKEYLMKNIAQRLVTLLLLCAFAMPAQGSEFKKTLNLTRDSVLGGQLVKKGHYSVTFTDEDSAELDVTLARNEILKARCRALHLPEAVENSAVSYRIADDGSYKVIRIDFQGMKTSLVFE